MTYRAPLNRTQREQATVVDREHAIQIDLSQAASTAEALRQLEQFLTESPMSFHSGDWAELNTGELLLTPGVMSKMLTLTRRYNLSVQTIYSEVPQTQQSALDEGLMVRRSPNAGEKPSPLRQLLPKTQFDPQQFIQDAYKDLDLPFETIPKREIEAVAQPVLTDWSRPEKPVVEDNQTTTHDEHAALRAKLPQETLLYRQTLRSGQVLTSEGNVVIVGDAHSGSEIVAGGDIVVWGVLGGIAHAGKNGNPSAEIRALQIEAVQLRIADAIARRPDRLFKALNAAARRGPEVAKVKQGEIQIFEDRLER